jgi:hypothetical protein|tara:strand:+ start:796 stop:2928 length:2133 start_codon:yes stop_codon:yes gene_type:complete
MEEDDIIGGDELYIDDSDSSFVEDKKSNEKLDDPSVGSVVGFVKGKYSTAEKARYSDEQRWIKSYQNYRGIYGPDVQFTSTERSRIFIKVTKTKVLAAYGQIVDVLFGSNKFPIGINPTIIPEGVAESVHFETNDQARKANEELGVSEEDQKLLPGETIIDLQERLAGMKQKLEPVIDLLQEGPGSTPSQVTFHPALVAAKKMEKKIHDQLEESNARKQLRTAAFETALFGTGVMKGPFAVDKEYPNWDEDGNYSPVYKTIPQTSSVSIWNFYPDPDANNMDEAEYVIERHKMSRSQIRSLKNRPYFRSNAIDTAVEIGESYSKEWWEQVMEDADQETKAERFNVLEFWGYVDTDILKDHDVEIPKELKDKDQVSVNIWVCNDQVLRLVMNPFTPAILPYYAVPYEVNPYSFFGVGIAENMDDTQTLMNGMMRMSVDNAALSGNLLVEIDETNLAPGQDLSMYPGKVLRRMGGAPGQSIFGTKFPNVSNENMQMFDKARVLADESTGFPSFAHGQTGVSGVGRTASGISMLMSAANGSIRTVVKNVDDYLLGPLGKAFFSFNMQFDFDPEIKGDLEVKAEGTESLMANEVRSQRLMQFLGVVQNPALAPFAKMDYIIREIAKSMDLDPDKVANSMSDAAIQAEILKKFQAQNPPPEVAQGAPAPQGAPQQPPAGAQVQDTQGSGGGQVGTGTAPLPGEQGFTGNVGQAQA